MGMRTSIHGLTNGLKHCHVSCQEKSSLFPQKLKYAGPPAQITMQLHGKPRLARDCRAFTEYEIVTEESNTARNSLAKTNVHALRDRER